MAVIATVFTISGMVHPLLKSLMGRFIPWSMGPMATAFSEARWTALYVLLPVFKYGSGPG